MAFCFLPSAYCLPPSAYLLLASILVPRAGFEPAQSLDHEILSLARIPISPPRPSHITAAWQESLLIRRDALRPPHPLGGVAMSRSLFVATPPPRHG